MSETDQTPERENNVGKTTGRAGQHDGKTLRHLDAKFSGFLAPVEKALDGVFGTKAPYQLPADMKDLLVKIAPWLSLIAGVLGVLSALSLWRAAHYVDRLSEALGVSTYIDSQLSLMFWLSMIMTVVFSVLAFLAFPGLRAKKKIGWNLMFYSMIANIVYGVMSLFYDNGGISALITALIMSAVGFYILFQIRDRYKV